MDSFHCVRIFDGSSKVVDVPFTVTSLRLSKWLSCLSEYFMVISSKQTRAIQQQINMIGNNAKNVTITMYI